MICRLQPLSPLINPHSCLSVLCHRYQIFVLQMLNLRYVHTHNHPKSSNTDFSVVITMNRGNFHSTTACWLDKLTVLLYTAEKTTSSQQSNCWITFNLRGGKITDLAGLEGLTCGAGINFDS